MDTFIDILYVNGLYAHQHEVFTIIRTLRLFLRFKVRMAFMLFGQFKGFLPLKKPLKIIH